MRHQQGRPEPAAVDDSGWSLFEHSTVLAAILVGDDGRIVAANARLRGFLGVSSSTELVGRAIAEFLVSGADWAVWQRASTQPAAVTTRLRAVNGAVVALRGDVHRLPAPRQRSLCGIFVDVTEQEQLRSAVERSARMEALGSLTAGVAHDFNNLLTVLVGNLYLMGEELRDRPKLFEKLKSARDAGKRGAELIKQLLAFARRETVETGTIEPAKVVDNLAPLLRRALGSRIALDTELEPSAGAIRAGAAQLESVVVNLAINARDAIVGRGRVKVGVARVQLAPPEAQRRRLGSAGPFVAISVADDGAGIPEEVLGRVFEPFFSTKAEGSGTGLGLSMVRWFAEQAGGTVEVESALRVGTTVRLLLPRVEHTASEPTDKTMPLSTLPTGTERVVVLAADEELRSTIRQILEVLGYAVRFSATAAELLTAAETESIDLAIIDGASSHERVTLARVRALRPNLKWIVTVAADGSGADASAGAALLRKPFSLGDLAATVRGTLDSPA